MFMITMATVLKMHEKAQGQKQGQRRVQRVGKGEEQPGLAAALTLQRTAQG